jgi:hypothetical protein
MRVAGLLEATLYQRHPPRFAYMLTDKGQNLASVNPRYCRQVRIQYTKIQRTETELPFRAPSISVNGEQIGFSVNRLSETAAQHGNCDGAQRQAVTDDLRLIGRQKFPFSTNRRPLLRSD